MPAFTEILGRVAAFYRDQRASVTAQNASLRGVFADIEPPAAPAGLAVSREPLERARQNLAAAFDARFGGFGQAPKFPQATSIGFLLRTWQATVSGPVADADALRMALLTLRRMAEGGIFDQLGGGFCRYSVDPYWMIPHFEKMLYDNGALLALCAQAAVATGDGVLRETALATGRWALDEMRAPQGGFYAAIDADSEGHEGRFYAWQREEVERLLVPAEYRVLARRFGLDREPNFEGAWHLHGYVALEQVARELELPEREARELLTSAQARLFAARAARVRPGLDDKILTAWNGLMIRGLAIAGRLLDVPEFIAAALAAIDFLRRESWRDGRLYAAWKDGTARFPAYLDDHAFLLDGLLEALQSRFRLEDLDFACRLADVLLERFADRERGGFWFTADGADTPLGRSKVFADEAMASGNGVAAQALARLGWLTGETRYLDAAQAAVRGGYASLTRAPDAHAALLNALDEQLGPVEIVVVRGDPAELAAWQAALGRAYAPRRMVVAIPSDVMELPPALAAKRPRERAVAYVCCGPVCSEPLLDPTAITGAKLPA
jgi:hypothetical protein